VPALCFSASRWWLLVSDIFRASTLYQHNYRMVVGTDDSYHEPVSLETFQDGIILGIFLVPFPFLIYLLVKCISNINITLNSSAGKLSLVLIFLDILFQAMTIYLLYADPPKIFALIFTILGALIVLTLNIGLLNILKGFCIGSKIITYKRIKWMKVFFVLLHVILIGPNYYMMRYWNEENPISTRPFGYMQKAYMLFNFLYCYWQFIYMAIYMNNVYKEIEKYTRIETTRKSMVGSYRIIISGMIFVIAGFASNFLLI
jgi:hypothetical protein